MSLSNYQRIKKVMNYYYLRGVSNKKVEEIYYKILFNKYNIKNNFVSLYKSSKI